jgi:hypothetical protein
MGERGEIDGHKTSSDSLPTPDAGNVVCDTFGAKERKGEMKYRR